MADEAAQETELANQLVYSCSAGLANYKTNTFKFTSKSVV